MTILNKKLRVPYLWIALALLYCIPTLSNPTFDYYAPSIVATAALLGIQFKKTPSSEDTLENKKK